MRIPDGYRMVMVELSDGEYDALQNEGGTVSAAIRRRMNLLPRPAGIEQAEAEQRKRR